MLDYFDDLEIRSKDEREADLMRLLHDQFKFVKEKTPYYKQLFKDVPSDEISSREALANLPVTRKSDLIEIQQKQYPFGGLTPKSNHSMNRIFQSPGPIYELQGKERDFFRMSRALFAAGFRAGDMVHNSFSYHLTPGGFIFDSGARALGCSVIPAGVGNTEQQLDIINNLEPVCYAGTPSFLKILFKKADELGLKINSFKKAIVSGEYFPPSLREEWASNGLIAYQSYASAELGLIAYESEALEGMIVDEGVIVEIVRPGTGDLVPDGEVGEVVVTIFSKEYPLIRFASGDLSAVKPGKSSCGRTNMLLQGWMGRADQTTKIKGLFVHPEQIAQIVSRHKEIIRARLVVESLDDQDIMTLICEVNENNEMLLNKVTETLQSICNLRGTVVFMNPGTIDNDGLVIEDKRSYN